MKRVYKYKLKPTMKQQRQLMQAFGCARFIYNWGLERKIKAWNEEHRTLSFFDLAKEMTQLKQTEEYKWLNDVPAVCLQQSLRNLDNAYTRFFKAKKGFPKFKSRRLSRSSSKYISSVHFDFERWRVTVPKCGWVKMCKNRPFDTENSKLGTLTVSMDRCGEFWCSILVDDGKEMRPRTKVSEDTAVGIDLGLKDFAILSDGTKYGNPRFLEKGRKRLAVLQRRFSKTQKDSKRRESARLKVARLHRKIANRRSDFLHKLSTILVRNYGTICLEDLNVQGMMKNRHLSLCIQSASWSEFVRLLGYKSEWNGKNIMFIGRFEPSSRMCSHCGYVNHELSLNDRDWVCPVCGMHHDRDVNAALNIKSFALHPQSLVAFQEKTASVIESCT